MKKIIIILFALLLTLSLSSCVEENDFELLKIEFKSSEEKIEELNQKITELEESLKQFEKTQQERFMYEMLMNSMLGVVVFAEIGETIIGSVDAYGYGYIIIELDRTSTVTFEGKVLAPMNSWNMNIYYDADLYDVRMNFEGIVVGQKYTVYLNPGFNVIEIDSYYNFLHPFEIEIREVI